MHEYLSIYLTSADRGSYLL